MTLLRCVVLLSTLAIIMGPAAAQTPPNPYHEVPNFAKFPEGRMWGHVFGVGIDSHRNVWALDRCEGSSCVGSNLPPIHEFDSSGKYLKSLGEGLFVFPHSLFVDKDDNIWVTDCGVSDGKGNQVLKLSPDGKVLLTLGKKGVFGGGPENFIGPTDLVVAPNGDIFVADGHAAGPLGGGEFYGWDKGNNEGSLMRIAKFSKDGKFIKSWGKLGTGPGEFNVPHGISIDSTGRIFVADRGNNRLQIFDQDGNFLKEWKQFGKPIGVFVDKKDIVYVADSDSNAGLWSWKYSVNEPCPSVSCVKRVQTPPDVGLDNQSFTQGVRIGSAKDGVVRAYIPPIMGPTGPTNLTKRLTVDANGDVFLAEGRTMHLRKYIKN
jgi:DNA-binding beta-propeller fold protein YncE